MVWGLVATMLLISTTIVVMAVYISTSVSALSNTVTTVLAAQTAFLVEMNATLCQRLDYQSAQLDHQYAQLDYQSTQLDYQSAQLDYQSTLLDYNSALLRDLLDVTVTQRDVRHLLACAEATVVMVYRLPDGTGKQCSGVLAPQTLLPPGTVNHTLFLTSSYCVDATTTDATDIIAANDTPKWGTGKGRFAVLGYGVAGRVEDWVCDRVAAVATDDGAAVGVTVLACEWSQAQRDAAGVGAPPTLSSADLVDRQPVLVAGADEGGRHGTPWVLEGTTGLLKQHGLGLALVHGRVASYDWLAADEVVPSEGSEEVSASAYVDKGLLAGMVGGAVLNKGCDVVGVAQRGTRFTKLTPAVQHAVSAAVREAVAQHDGS